MKSTLVNFLNANRRILRILNCEMLGQVRFLPTDLFDSNPNAFVIITPTEHFTISQVQHTSMTVSTQSKNVDPGISRLKNNEMLSREMCDYHHQNFSIHPRLNSQPKKTDYDNFCPTKLFGSFGNCKTNYCWLFFEWVMHNCRIGMHLYTKHYFCVSPLFLFCSDHNFFFQKFGRVVTFGFVDCLWWDLKRLHFKELTSPFSC